MQVWWSSLLAADRALLDVLDPVERARVASLDRPADQGRSLVAAALLRVVAAAHLGIEPAAVVVDRTCAECGGPHGRPRVLGPGGPGPHVSVSHSGTLVVVASSPDVPVGVDVQRVEDLGGEPASRGAAARRWVAREAEAKLGAGAGPAAVRPLRAPLAGYAAALAVPAGPAGGTPVEIRHWPDATPEPGRRRPGP